MNRHRNEFSPKLHGVVKEPLAPSYKPRPQVGDEIDIPNLREMPRGRKGTVIAVHQHYVICKVSPSDYLECINI